MDLANYADDHWIPYYLFCTPCLLNYDIIAKVETYLEDQVYIIRALGLQDSIRPRWKHRSSSSSAGSPQDSPQDLRASLPPSSLPVNSIGRKYFSQLNESELRALHEKYRLDFELFDYSVDDYLPFVAAE